MRESTGIAMMMGIEGGIIDMKEAIVEVEEDITMKEDMEIMMDVKEEDIMITEETGVTIDKIITGEMEVDIEEGDRDSIEELLDNSKLGIRWMWT